MSEEPEEVPLRSLRAGAFGRLPLSGLVLEVIEHSPGASRVRQQGETDTKLVSRNTMVIPITENEVNTLSPARSRRAKSKGEKPMQTTTTVKDGESKYNLIKDPAVQAEFWKQVTKGKANECWNWTGRKTGDSGAFFVNNVELRVGKLAYLIANPSADPDGRYTATVCRNAACCNAAHITQAGVKKAEPAKEAPVKSKGKDKGKAETPAPKPEPAKPAARKAAKKADEPKPEAKAPLSKKSAKSGGLDMSKLPLAKPAKKSKGKKQAAADAQ